MGGNPVKFLQKRITEAAEPFVDDLVGEIRPLALLLKDTLMLLVGLAVAVLAVSVATLVSVHARA